MHAATSACAFYLTSSSTMPASEPHTRAPIRDPQHPGNTAQRDGGEFQASTSLPCTSLQHRPRNLLTYYNTPPSSARADESSAQPDLIQGLTRRTVSCVHSGSRRLDSGEAHARSRTGMGRDSSAHLAGSRRREPGVGRRDSQSTAGFVLRASCFVLRPSARVPLSASASAAASYRVRRT